MDALRRRTAARLAAIVGLSVEDIDDPQTPDEASVPLPDAARDVAADAAGVAARTAIEGDSDVEADAGALPSPPMAAADRLETDLEAEEAPLSEPATLGGDIDIEVEAAAMAARVGTEGDLDPERSPETSDHGVAPSALAEAAPAALIAVMVADDDAPLASSRDQGWAANASSTSALDEAAVVATLVADAPGGRVPVSPAATPIALPVNAVAVMAEPAPADAAGAKGSQVGPAGATTPRGSRARSTRPAATGGNGTRRKRRKPASTLLPAACPTCGHLLEEIPSTTRRCVECRQRIFVKRLDGHVVLIAEAVAPLFDAERRRLVDAERLKRDCGRWLQMAALAGAAPEVLEARAQAVAARPTQEAVTAARTLYATTVDRACRAARRLREWQMVADLRLRQARAYHRASGSPIPPEATVLALHREGIEASLRRIAELARDAELSGGQCCEACKADTGRLVRISVERKAPSLPHADCPAGLCGCRWDVPAKQREALAKLSRRRATSPTGRVKASRAG